ncbi:minichromosome maintenance protein [Encephalitozoon hellem ATCC 50504]|uniref:DNA replication licensing factor MCM7 n=1 Tax=Encephalitozoon hellem TaxID=27973 RepID=A0A9Q9CDR3_ENCHE|nr:minichromosome maintenance protein [Encephalitozoon hellem ATCC 50504]AFM99026.1 minichromosome maintenance protein [Encephalitozoon hellem ATCC 50504]UTX44044.1 DNA replication licensing factor MCM7 [Encephalitozoon hellem]WEL39527.1 minichromosome maintainence P-loop domain-containing protein [Encephalitozoon hellem]|eukprot:XP_003888007.1 minichromosome maintenance protein [Encephalitozoon hellem ATCC 50504]
MNQVSELRRFETSIDYQLDKDRLGKFLLFYEEDGELAYVNRLRESKGCVEIDMEDIAVYDESGLVNRIEGNAMSYINLLYTVIDEILLDSGEISGREEPEDVFFYHRISRLKERFPEKKATDVFPSFLLRRYSLVLKPRRNTRVYSVRELKSMHIGSLIRVSGIVTKVSQVKPSIKVATYICESCGAETYQQVDGDVFDLLEECGSEKCRIRNVRGTLILVTRGSKFIKHQTVYMQELTGDIPRGCIPRTLVMECYSSLAEECRPGDVVVAGGVFMPKPYYGIKKLKAGLLADVYLHATSVQRIGARVFDINREVKAYPVEQMVRSIAPEIFGMEDIKKILLLMLIGAPGRVREDGMRIRGDINVLLVGDPGIAKSQLLKTCVKISRRGVYTTGKGSSGVGLTASVTKDQITGEMILEGGALVLADGGICCIDELDKMNEVDRISIHEVMEQQSVSISKAGINTSLNARCCVLGAANPVRGRYDIKQSIEHNIGLPCSLLSRFDVVAILRDESNLERDESLANHITSLHLQEEPETIPYDEIRGVIDEAKKIDPILPPHLSSKLTDAYVRARKESPYVTPRYLLSLIRLSLAHCRLRLSAEVGEEDINEALRLMNVTRIPVPKKKREEVSSKREIYNLILSLAAEEGNRKYVKLERLWEATKDKYSTSEVEDVISDFASCGIWIRNNEELVIFN